MGHCGLLWVTAGYWGLLGATMGCYGLLGVNKVHQGLLGITIQSALVPLGLGRLRYVLCGVVFGALVSLYKARCPWRLYNAKP